MRILIPSFIVFPLLCCLSLGLLAQKPAQEDRSLPRIQSGKPIPELVDKYGDLILLSSDSPPLLVEPPAGVREIEWMTQLSPVVLLIKVVQMDGRLSDDLRWVESEVQAEIVTVFRDAGKTFVPNKKASFLFSGGEAEFSGHKVKTVRSWAEDIEIGKEYLIFTEPRPDGRMPIHPSAAYRLEDGYLKNLGSGPRPGELAELPWAEIALKIQRLVAQKNW